MDCCVLLNQWEKALELAERYDYPQVELLLIKSAVGLINAGRKLEAVELFRVANKPTEAAILIGDIAENVAERNVDPLLAKKLHVLAALEIERHRKHTLAKAAAATTGADGGTGLDIAQTTAATLETLMFTALDGGGAGGASLGGTLAATLGATLGTADTAGGGVNAKRVSKAFTNAWRGAAAYHYYMLALRQFYNGQSRSSETTHPLIDRPLFYFSGSMDAAMKTSIKLCEFDDILNARHIYSLLCLTSLRNKFYGICSKAFVKVS